MIELKLKLKQGDTVKQIVDTSTGKAYIRTATLSTNNPSAPINPPTGFIVVSWIGEHDTELTLIGEGIIMDNDGNPYAPLLDV